MSLMMMLIVYIAMFGVHDSGYLYSTGMKEKRMDNDNSRTDRLAVNVADASQALGISRSSMYAEIKRGRIQTFKLAGRLLIPWTELTALMSGELPHKTEIKDRVLCGHHPSYQQQGWQERAETAERELAEAREDTKRLSKLEMKTILAVGAGIQVSALGGLAVNEWHGEQSLRDFIDSIEDEVIDAAREGDGA